MAHVEGGAAETQVVVRLLLIVARPTHSFLRSADPVLTASPCEVVAGSKAAEVGRGVDYGCTRYEAMWN